MAKSSGSALWLAKYLLDRIQFDTCIHYCGSRWVTEIFDTITLKERKYNSYALYCIFPEESFNKYFNCINEDIQSLASYIFDINIELCYIKAYMKTKDYINIEMKFPIWVQSVEKNKTKINLKLNVNIREPENYKISAYIADKNFSEEDFDKIKMMILLK